MMFLKLNAQSGASKPASYERLGYLRNPFPQRGEVAAKIYVERPELSRLQVALGNFLQDPEASGGFWAVKGEAGLGKSNCLQHIDYAIGEASRRGEVTGVISRYIGNQPISSRNLVEQILQALGSERLCHLLEQRPATPTPLLDTDFGRFLAALRSDRKLSAMEGAQFLMRWLGGHQTYSEERERYGLWSREHMLPAVAFPYLRDLIELLAAAGLVNRIVLLIDEFEDVQKLPDATQRDYVGSLKSLVNVFNWRRLFLIVSGQEAVFTTIEQRFTSIRDRWKAETLLPLQEAQDALRLAKSYQLAEREAFLTQAKASAGNLPAELEPTGTEIQLCFANLLKKGTVGVKQRDLLAALHELVEERVHRQPGSG